MSRHTQSPQSVDTRQHPTPHGAHADAELLEVVPVDLREAGAVHEAGGEIWPQRLHPERPEKQADLVDAERGQLPRRWRHWRG